MKTGLLNRLMANGITLSIIVSMLMLTTLSWSALAQTPASGVPAQSAASGVPAQADTLSAPEPLLRNTFNHMLTGFPLKGVHLSVACETCHMGGTFKGTPKDCAACHSVGRLIAATPKTQDHIPTTKACDACHSNSASFLAAVMDHNGLTIPCAVCHNGSYSPTVKSVPSDSLHSQNSNLGCDSCHKNTYVFSGTRFDHTNTTGDCANCHNGVTAQGKSATHLATSAPCETCHTPAITPGWPAPTAFLGAGFDHSTLVPGTTCITCHNGQLAGVTSKPSSHIPTSLTCETCHSSISTNAGGFKAPSWTMNHAGITAGCSSCHSGQSFQGAVPNPLVTKPSNHIATTAACELCHSAASTSIGGFAAPNWTMNHAANGNTSGCASCHLPGGDSTLGTAVIKGKSANHMPLTGQTPMTCESCHSNTSVGGFAVPNPAMNHAGITANCAVCHNGNDVGATVTTIVLDKPATHIPTTADCSICHTNTTITGGFSTWTMNHAGAGITSGCANCHASGLSFQNTNGAPLVTLSTTNHVPVTGISCESCHIPASTGTGAFSSAWVMGTAGHALVAGTSCETCHDTGATFMGVKTKSAAHIAYTAGTSCGTCHTQASTGGYTTFLNAAFDHSSTNAACSNCHGGSISGIKPKSANHILTTLECNVCHTAPAGVAAVNGFAAPNPAMDHTGITTACASCHNGSNAGSTVTTTVLGKPANHIATSLACEVCHSTAPTGVGPIGGFATDWSMSHTGIASGCASCHLQSGDSTVGHATIKGKPATHVATSIACESCHSITSTGSNGFAAPNWTMNHTANGNTSNCASCHTGATQLNTVVVGKPATHIPTTAACESCHSSSSTSTGGFVAPGWSMGVTGHTAVNSMPPSPATRCDSCHGLGKSFQGVTITNQDSINPHPITVSADCGTCHGSVTSFLLSTTYSHTPAPTTCANCHDGNIALGKPPGHLTTNVDCNSCHVRGVFTTGGFQMFPGGAHVATTAGQCGASCHNGSTVSGTLNGQPEPGTHGTAGTHISTNGSIAGAPVDPACDACHKNTTSFLGATMDHSGISSGCATCHGGAYPGLLSKPAYHLATALACETCHNNTLPPSGAIGGFASPNWTMQTAQHTSNGNTLTCENCHLSSGDATSGTAVVKGKPAYHIPTTLACVVCHASTHSNTGDFATQWTMDHAANGNNLSGCATCHTGATLGATVVKGKPSNHIPTSVTCETCHSISNFSSFVISSTAMSHAGITSGCASCHPSTNVGTAVAMSVLGKPVNHMPTTAACELCHINTAIPNGFQTWTMNHTGIASGCATCHATGSSFQNTSGTPLVTKPAANHVTITAACESCHSASSTGTGGFAAPSWLMGVTGHTAVNSMPPTPGIPCSNCHTGQTFVTGVTPKQKSDAPLTHVTTSADCGTCHGAVTSFQLSITFSHSPVPAGQCASCHNGTIALGKPPGHVVSALSCDSCHTNGVFTTGGFKMNTFLHLSPAAAVSGSHQCGTSCHNGSTVNGNSNGAAEPSTHINVGLTAIPAASCDSCHGNTTSFLGATMDHAGTTTGCSNCHGGQFPGVVSKPSFHIATTIACESCHSASSTGTGGFAAPHWTMDHTANGNTSACASCHLPSGDATLGTAVVKGKTANHTPTSAACEACHSTANTGTGGFATPNPAMNHAGMTTGCATCHTGANVGTSVSTIVLGKPANHTPTTAACETCHTATPTGVGPIGGFATPNPAMNHAGMTTGCATCHTGANVGTTVSTMVLGKPATHILTTAACETCHTTAPSGAGPIGGFVAPNWIMGTTGHTAVNSMPPSPATRCDSCHGLGKSFQGVTITNQNSVTNPHPVTISADCGTCHGSVTSFVSSTTYTHNPVPAGQCSNCHNGAIALGKPAGHLATSASCDSCHTSGVYTVGGFQMAAFNHLSPAAAVFGSHACGTSCHNGSSTVVLSGAPEPSTHIPVALAGIAAASCDSCHVNTTSFLGATMNHAGISTGCATCHAGTYPGVVSKPSFHIATSIACETCHNNTLPPSGAIGGFAAPNWTMQAAQHTANGNTTACESCHLPSGDATLGSVAVKGKPASHIPLSVSTCVTCHTSTSAGGFATWTMSHTGITSGCVTCHAGQTFQATTVPAPATMPPVAKPVNHIPTTAACESCHSNTTTPNGFRIWTMSHVGITSGCASCHASGLSFQNTTGTPLVTLNTAIHIPVGSTPCESCHNPATTATGGFALKTTGWIMGTTGHALVSGNTCASCHTQGATTSPYTGVVAQNSIINPHVPATAASCDTCHTSSNTSGFTTFLGATGAHTSNPVPSVGPSCSGCHGTTIVATGPGGGKGMVANHIPIGALDCSSCHGWSSFTTWSSPAVHTAVTAMACSACHNSGLSYVGVVIKPAAHITTAATCNSCHTPTTYVSGNFNAWTMSHTGITTGCASCHAAGLTFPNNGGTPLVKLSTTIHVPVGSTACEACHSASNFATGAFATAWTMGTTGHAPVATTSCATCHGTAGSAFTGVKIIDSAHISSSYYPAQDCGTNCHTAATTSNYSVGGFLLLNMAANVPSHSGTGVSPYLCSNCHNNTIAKGAASFTGHVAIGSSDCVSCHTQTNTTNYTNFLGATAGHDTSTAGQASALHNCAKSGCHVTGGAGKVFATQHIPSSSPGATIAANGIGQCDYCHTTSYTGMLFTAYASATVHSATSYPAGTKCSTCHSGNYTAEGAIGAQAKTLVKHIPTTITDASGLDCTACHYYPSGAGIVISATAFSGKQTLGEYMNHNGAKGGAPNYCVTCHLKGVTYLSGAQLISHNGASTTKDCSSTSCHKPLGKNSDFGNYVR